MKKIKCINTNEEFFKYDDYLKSKHWKLKKKDFKSSKLFKKCCAVCKNKSNLHIHHKTYKRIGKEYLNDLIALCEKCHFNLHELYDDITFFQKRNHHILIKKLKNNLHKR